MLESDQSLPRVAPKPAPWHLSGSAYVLALRMPESWSLETGTAARPLALAMFFDYERSDVGPFRELLVAAARRDFGDGHYPTVTNIYVSRYEAVVNGRNNWGIAKDRADFSVARSAEHVDEVQVARHGQTFAELALRPFGPNLPVTSALLPRRTRTLTQDWLGRRFRFTMHARGRMRMAQLIAWRFDARFFPDLARGRLLAAAYFPRFELTFPVPGVSQIGRR